jgi:DNA-binding NtrC family response regulator
MTATIELQDRTNQAEHIVSELVALIDYAAMPPEARVLVETAARVYERTADTTEAQTSLRRLAYVLMIDGLLGAPEAMQQALRQLRADLVAQDAGLALVRGHTAG